MYERPIRDGYKKVENFTEDNENNEKNLIKNMKEVAVRRRNNIRRLALVNFNHLDKFITLTFKENIVDISLSNKLFKQFIQRLRYRLGNFKYLAVIQFQERGAVHYHMLADIGYIKSEELEKIWGNGFIKINAIDNVDNVGAYIVSYMVKDFMDKRLRGRKAYFLSKNLDRPKIIKGVGEDDLSKELDMYLCYESEYMTEENGICRYKEFNLRRCRK